MVPYTARSLITSKNTNLSSINYQVGSYTRPGAFTNSRGNVRERRITVSFGLANAPKVVYHGLGFPPSGFLTLGQSGAGTIYNKFPLRSTSQVIVLMSDTANLVADILVR